MKTPSLRSLKSKARKEGWSQWIQSSADEAALLEDCYFDEKKALRVVQFFENVLVHSEGKWAGQPFELMEWQKNEIIMPLFGWMRSNGTRRYRQAFIFIPKKNGKSALASGIALYLLMADGEPRSEVYSAAADRKQAGIVFESARAFVENSPIIKDRIDLIPSTKTMTHMESGSKYQVLSREHKTSEGWKIHGLIFDELHVQAKPDLFDALRYGGASRSQPLLFVITTAGYDKNSICYEQYEQARRILEGKFQKTSLFPYIREVGKEEDWGDPVIWKNANPSLGLIIDEIEFKDAFEEAREIPRLENVFRRYRLNQWTSSEERWMNMDRWNACNAPVYLDELEGLTCYGGLDLSSNQDITAFVLMFPREEDGEEWIDVVPYFWIPQENAIEKEKEDHFPYSLYAKQGFLEMTPGDCIDTDLIFMRICELYDLFQIEQIRCDPWESLTMMIRLENEGITTVKVPQRMQYLSPPMKEFERLILTQGIRHGGHPVLTWMVENTQVKIDSNGFIRPCKEKSIHRIDGVVASVLSLGGIMEKNQNMSVYESKELTTVESPFD